MAARKPAYLPTFDGSVFAMMGYLHHNTPSGPHRDLRAQSRGVALLMVLVFTALLAGVVSEFQLSSRVDLQLALNARDGLQAEYNALSALRLRAVILRKSQQLSGQLKNTPLKGLVSSAQLAELIPVECGIMSSVLKEIGVEPGSEDSDGELDEGFFPGECQTVVQSEHSKIPIMLLKDATSKRNQTVARSLIGLLQGKRFERHFEEDDALGNRAESAEELVGAITDWIDLDDVAAMNGVGDEERPYSRLADYYRPKNAHFDSVAELQLVHGIDDDLYALLGEQVTIYANGNPTIELGTASLFAVLTGLLSARKVDVSQQMLLENFQFQSLMADLREMVGIAGSLSGLPLNRRSLTAQIQARGLGGLIDVAELGKVFNDGSSTTWFSIIAEGQVGRATHRIRTIFQAGEGRFYYYRVE